MCLQDILKKASYKHVLKTSWRRLGRHLGKILEDFLKTCCEYIMKTSLDDVLQTRFEDVLQKLWKMKNCYLEDDLKTFWKTRNVCFGDIWLLICIYLLFVWKNDLPSFAFTLILKNTRVCNKFKYQEKQV